MQLIVECGNCGFALDPNSDENADRWGPPLSRRSPDLGSLECPNCGQRADFSEWKAVTSKDKIDAFQKRQDEIASTEADRNI